jgi:hypothetical protein
MTARDTLLNATQYLAEAQVPAAAAALNDTCDICILPTPQLRSASSVTHIKLWVKQRLVQVVLLLQ